jgi:hypothetical protein
MEYFRALPILVTGLALSIFAVEVPGRAQSRPGAPAPTPDVLPAPGQGAGPSSDAPAAAEDKKVITPAAGYAYGDGKSSASRAPHARYRSSGPVVTMPGFEQTSDGGSRFFVQLSQTVPVEERRAQGSITYVLKGASPRVWNNTNALVTVHFNTPVSRARLVPQGRDLLFVVDLRAAATPTWKVNEGENKTATLQIDFPKGDFLPAPGAEPAASAPKAAAKAPRGKRGSQAPAKPAPANAPNP